MKSKWEERFEKIIIETSICLRESVPSDNIAHLFHYTRKSNEKQILKNNKIDFRMSKARELLDQNEGNSIFEPYYHACGCLFDKQEIDDKFFRLVRSITPEMLSSKEDTWILSLSSDGDSSFLKERYAAKDCLIIGLQAHRLLDLKDSESNCESYVNFQVLQVCYSFADMKENFSRILREAYGAYCLPSRKTKDIKNRIIGLLVEALETYRYEYKERTYQEEREIRLVFQKRKAFNRLKVGNDAFLQFDERRQLHLIMNQKPYLFCIYDNTESTNSETLNKSVCTPDDFHEWNRRNRESTDKK